MTAITPSSHCSHHSANHVSGSLPPHRDRMIRPSPSQCSHVRVSVMSPPLSVKTSYRTYAPTRSMIIVHTGNNCIRTATHLQSVHTEGQTHALKNQNQTYTGVHH